MILYYYDGYDDDDIDDICYLWLSTNLLQTDNRIIKYLKLIN